MAGLAGSVRWNRRTGPRSTLATASRPPSGAHQNPRARPSSSAATNSASPQVTSRSSSPTSRRPRPPPPGPASSATWTARSATQATRVPVGSTRGSSTPPAAASCRAPPGAAGSATSRSAPEASSRTHSRLTGSSPAAERRNATRAPSAPTWNPRGRPRVNPRVRACRRGKLPELSPGLSKADGQGDGAGGQGHGQDDERQGPQPGGLGVGDHEHAEGEGAVADRLQGRVAPQQADQPDPEHREVDVEGDLGVQQHRPLVHPALAVDVADPGLLQQRRLGPPAGGRAPGRGGPGRCRPGPRPFPRGGEGLIGPP